MKLNLKTALISKGSDIAKFFSKTAKYTVATISGSNCSAESYDSVQQACETNIQNLGELMEGWVTDKPTSDLELTVTMTNSGVKESVTVRFPAPQKYLATQAITS